MIDTVTPIQKLAKITEREIGTEKGSPTYASLTIVYKKWHK